MIWHCCYYKWGKPLEPDQLPNKAAIGYSAEKKFIGLDEMSIFGGFTLEALTGDGGRYHPRNKLENFLGDIIVDIYFKEEVTYGRETYNPSLEVLSDSDVNASGDDEFCGYFGCVNGMVPIVPNVTYGVP